MCVIERKKYIQPDGQEEIVESLRRCHRAADNTVCQHVERKTLDPIVLSEVRPSFSTQQPKEDLVVTKDKTYRRLSGRKNSQSTSTRPKRDSITPTKITSSPYAYNPVEVRPSFTQASGSRPVSVSYEQGYPPSVNDSRAKESERLRSSRPTTSAPSSSKYSVDPAKIIYREVRPSKVTITSSSSPASYVSSAPTTPPLGSTFNTSARWRSDSFNDLTAGMPQSSRAKEKQPVRDEGANSEADRRQDIHARLRARNEEDARARSQAEEERQALLMRETLSSTEQRQRAREAEAEAKARERQRKQDEVEARERDRREAKSAAKIREQQRLADAEAAEERVRQRHREEARQAEEAARLRARRDSLAAERALEDELARARAHQEAVNERAQDAGPGNTRSRMMAAERKQMAEERIGLRRRDSPLGLTFPSSASAASAASSPMSARASLAPGSPASAYSTRNPNARIVLHQGNAVAASSSSRPGTDSPMQGRGDRFISRLPSDEDSALESPRDPLMAESERLRGQDEPVENPAEEWVRDERSDLEARSERRRRERRAERRGDREGRYP